MSVSSSILSGRLRMSHQTADVLSSIRLMLPILREAVLTDGRRLGHHPQRRGCRGKPYSFPGHPRSGAAA